MFEPRRLLADDSDCAAEIHRRAGALIPGYDTSLHSADEYRTFYRETVMREGPVWGAYHADQLCGHVALRPGWIDHLYVSPDFQGRGIGSCLVRLAQREQSELRLFTFQANLRARQLYERHGFRIEALTNGERNEEKMPEMTYHWARPT